MDVALADLWLPILVSAAVVFVASFIAWTISPHHKGEWKPLPDEAAFLASVRDRIPAGQYMFPHCDPSQRKDPQAMERMKAGPHGVMIVWGRSPEQMGGKLLATFIYYRGDEELGRIVERTQSPLFEDDMLAIVAQP